MYECEPREYATKWGIAFGFQTPTITATTKLVEPLKFKKLTTKQTPLEIFSKIHKQNESAYLLESIEGPKRLAQYSFLGFAPQLTIIVKNGVETVRDEFTGDEEKQRVTDPLQTIKQAVSGKPTANKDFRFVGGAVGYLSYDTVRYWENLPIRSKESAQFADVEMGVFNDGIVFDHKQKRAHYYYYTRNRLSEIEQVLRQPLEHETLSSGMIAANTTKEDFEKAVETAKSYISSGDIFQVVLSKRFDFCIRGDLTEFYAALRTINPSPYMYFYSSGSRQIVGSSPEMLARVENRTVETYPIAGTRPTGATPAENRRLALELLSDPKERAEHVMLVDLARNDVGKVSKFGSVRVPEFMQVHRYSHVHHIVSRAVGDLREECDCFDTLRSVFPAGTVSGAPKVRAMEIIDELEPSRRGPYAGAVGYFSFNGNMDFAITIRTLFADGDKASVQAGAGIVADSVPEREWFETEHKAGALMKALQVCGGKGQ